MNARPNAWLRQAENDLALAQLARDNGFLAQACYYASQAAEKGLKSALLELGEEPPHTHVLNDLVSRLQQNGLDTRALDALPRAASAEWRSNPAIPWMPPRHLSCSIRQKPIKP